MANMIVVTVAGMMVHGEEQDDGNGDDRRR